MKDNINILIVDDNEKFLKSMTDRARMKGYTVFSANSGKEALRIAKKERVHVAVVDQVMPEMDGLVVITKLKALLPDLKTVLLTGHGDQKLKEATEALNSTYFDKAEMGKLWSFLSDLPLGNVNILLVDDHPKFLDALTERIRLKGYDPLTAVNGQQALEIARSTKIHLAIVDHKLPDIEGLVVITKLKEIDSRTQTLLLTGHGDENLKEATEALNSVYFDKAEMGKFWGFIRKVLVRLEDSMAAAGMATGGDLDDAVDIDSHHQKKK